MSRYQEVQPFSDRFPDFLLSLKASSFEYIKSYLIENISLEQVVLFEKRRKDHGNQNGTRRDFALTKAEIKSGELDKSARKLHVDSEENLFICSRVTNIPANTFSYLPLMELSISNTLDSATEAVKDKFIEKGIVQMTQGGAIFRNEDSYHFIGNRLISHDDQMRFLNLCAKTRVADLDFILKSQIKGSSSLRLTANGYKDVPRFAAAI